MEHDASGPFVSAFLVAWLTDSKADVIRERRARQEEKARLENMAAKMSAKKLQRMRKVSVDGVWCMAHLAQFRTSRMLTV